MKKFLKRLLIAVVVFAVFLLGSLVTLRVVFPPSKIKTLLTQYAQKNWGREISFDSLSFTGTGLKLNGFAVSEKNTFAQGTFIKAQQVIAKVALKPLLKKRIEIHTLQLNGLEINLIKQADGTFNFSSQKEENATPATSSANSRPNQEDTPLILQADELRATDCRLIYRDETSNNQTTVDHFNLAANHFDLSTPFDIHLDFTTRIQQKNQKEITLPLSVDGKVMLAELNWPQAHVDIQSFKLSYQTITLALQGFLKDFSAPDLSLRGTLNGISHTALADLYPNLSPFSVPELSFDTHAKLDLQNNTASFSSLKLSLQDNHLQTQGTVNWGTDIYDFTGTLQTELSQLVQISQSTFQPSGKVDGSFQFSSQTNDTHLSGKFNLQEVAFAYEPFTFEKLKGTLTLTSLSHWSGALTGLLNQENFVGNFDYQSTANTTDLLLNTTLDKLVLTQWPTTQGNGSETEEDQSSTTVNSTADTQKLFNLKANLRIGEITVPHFRSNGLTLNAALNGISSEMTQANGTLNFAFEPGAITELDKLVKENKFVKIILLPLSILRKVSNALNLNLFPTEKEKGTISFSQGEGAYTFTNGVMNVDKTVFKSSVTTINGTGTIDFPQDKVAMKATATVLTQAAPIIIKITGTPQDPKGKLDVAGTVGSVLEGLLSGKGEKAVVQEGTATLQTAEKDLTQDTQALTKDTLNDAAKTLKELGNLFKKKTEE